MGTMNYVPHPRYGASPRYTGLDPSPDDPGVFLHFNTNFFTEKQLASFRQYTRFDWKPLEDQHHVPGTAVAADLARQSPATMPVTHYFDIERRCRDCGRWFLFYACEQKHWYEELGFSLDSDCVRCVPCRKERQGDEARRARYVELCGQEERSVEDEVWMADYRLAQVAAGAFSPAQLERVREFLNKFPGHQAADGIRARLAQLEE